MMFPFFFFPFPLSTGSVSLVILKACHLALTTRAHGFLTANDGAEKSGSSTLADRIDLLLSALEDLAARDPCRPSLWSGPPAVGAPRYTHWPQ